MKRKNRYKEERNGNFRTKTIINKSFYRLNSKMERTEERISDVEDRIYHQLHPVHSVIHLLDLFLYLRWGGAGREGGGK